MHRLLRTLTSFLEGGASLTGMGKGESEGECMQTNVDKFWCEGCRDSWRGTRVKGFFVFCPSIKYAEMGGGDNAEGGSSALGARVPAVQQAWIPNRLRLSRQFPDVGGPTLESV